jgi:NAD+-dependent secondary alcohol dehydrogenase Adh1
MKAAVLHQYDTKLTNSDFVVLEEVPEPALEKSTDVIVRVGGAGVCRTDLHVIEGIWRQKVSVKLPYVMGQVLTALCGADVIALDRSDAALALAKECGAHYTVKADENQLEAIKALTDGNGAEAVIDFVGEGNSIDNGLAMTRRNGAYYIVDYGGEIRTSALEMITTEKRIIGNLFGNYTELVELMELADRGKVHLTTNYYKLDQANRALHDLNAGEVNGRAVLVP